MFTSPLRHFKSIFLLIFLLYSAQYSYSKSEYIENRPTKTIPVTTGSSHFNMELNYPNAFEVTIESYNNQEGQTGFCHTFPSKITPKVSWSGPIQSVSESASTGKETMQGQIEHYYDNIGHYKGYYFLLDSVTFEVTAIKNLTDPSSYIKIPSDFKNDFDEDRPEDAYLVVDSEVELLFIVTRKYLYTYDIFEFVHMDHQKAEEIPHIKDRVEHYGPYNVLISVKFYNSRLFIVADDIVDVYAIDINNNKLTKEIQLNNQYFGTNQVSIVSITFKGSYLFVLDNFRGVYLIDISNLNKAEVTDLRKKYSFQVKAVLEISDGQFIEAVGNTLQVIYKSTKASILREYIVYGDSVFSHYVLNRQRELYQSVMDTYADNNFFFMLTGYFNMMTKYGVLEKYNSTEVEDHLIDYWPIFGTKAIVSVPASGGSRIVVVHDNYMTMFRIYEKNPVISCNMERVEEGLYRYRIKALQMECQEKIKDRKSSHESVCVVNQELELIVIKEDADIGSTGKSKMTVLFLGVGIGGMLLLVVVFVCLVRKYKRQVDQLEDEIKFQKLEEEPEGQNGEGKVEIQLGGRNK